MTFEKLKNPTRNVVLLDKNYAEKILNLDEFLGERPLRMPQVKKLQEAIRRGTYLPEQTTIILATLKGKKYRLNGQHTGTAIFQYEGNLPEISVTELTYELDNENQLRQLYSSIDRGAARTKSNVLDAYLSDQPGVTISKNNIKLFAAGLTLWLNPERSSKIFLDGDALANLILHEHSELFTQVIDFYQNFSKEDKTHLCRAPVIAAMFATFSIDNSNAKSFWQDVAMGINLEQASAQLYLRNKLLRTSLSRSSKLSKTVVSQKQMYNHCIDCWNSFRQNKKVKSLSTKNSGYSTPM